MQTGELQPETRACSAPAETSGRRAQPCTCALFDSGAGHLGQRRTSSSRHPSLEVHCGRPHESRSSCLPWPPKTHPCSSGSRPDLHSTLFAPAVSTASHWLQRRPPAILLPSIATLGRSAAAVQKRAVCSEVDFDTRCIPHVTKQLQCAGTWQAHLVDTIGAR